MTAREAVLRLNITTKSHNSSYRAKILYEKLTGWTGATCCAWGRFLVQWDKTYKGSEWELMGKKSVDIIVPCHNESASLGLFFQAIEEQALLLPDYSLRLIFVDDGSRDNTAEIIRDLARQHSHVNYISFSRNFGKEAAMYAGLSHATGDFTVFIDADLQHPPALLAPMLAAVDGEGYDSCSARRVSREGEPKLRSLWARLFYKVINKMSEVEIVDGAVDYRLMNRPMTNAVLSLGEGHRFSKGIFAWVGFRTKWVEFKNIERIAGESQWSFWRLLQYAIDGTVAFTTAPLRFATVAGAGVSSLAAILLLWSVLALFLPLQTWGLSLWQGLLLLVGGLLLLACGFLGEYVAQIHVAVKNRPLYITRDSSFLS